MYARLDLKTEKLDEAWLKRAFQDLWLDQFVAPPVVDVKPEEVQLLEDGVKQSFAGFRRVGGEAPASADDAVKTESQRTAGKFVKWDKDAGTVLVKEKGKDVLFSVIAEGSVLTRTTVTVKAKPAKLADLQEGQIVVVYWRPAASDPNSPTRCGSVPQSAGDCSPAGGGT